MNKIAINKNMKRILVLILIGLIGVFGLSSCVGGVSPEHTHTEEVIPGFDATCTEAGLTEGKKCSECGEILVAQEEIPAKGHSYVDGKCECGADDPNYKKDINLREVYNIFNTINIVKTATDEEIKNIVNKWNDKLSGKIEGILWDYYVEMDYSLEYDFSKKNLDEAICNISSSCSEVSINCILENKVMKYYEDNIEYFSVSFEEYGNLTNAEFKNKVMEKMPMFEALLESIGYIYTLYDDKEEPFKTFENEEIIVTDVTMGYDENDYLIIGLINITYEYPFNARLVSDGQGNLLYAESQSFEGIKDEDGAIQSGQYIIFVE